MGFELMPHSNGQSTLSSIVAAPDSSRSLVLAFPLYNQVSAKWVIHMAGMDKSMVAGQIFTDGVYITEAMRSLVQKALEMDEPWERLVIMEHDMIVPLDALNRVATQYKPEHHIVFAMYFWHQAPFPPIAMFDDPETGVHLSFAADVVKELVQKPDVYECHAVGFGFTAIHRTVLENWTKT